MWKETQDSHLSRKSSCMTHEKVPWGKQNCFPLCSLVGFTLNDRSAALRIRDTGNLSHRLCCSFECTCSQQPTASNIHPHLRAAVPKHQKSAFAKYMNIWTEPFQRNRSQSSKWRVTSLSRWKDKKKNGQKTWSQPSLLFCGVGWCENRLGDEFPVHSNCLGQQTQCVSPSTVGLPQDQNWTSCSSLIPIKTFDPGTALEPGKT